MRNDKVEQQIGLIREGGRAAFEEAVLLFPETGNGFPVEALNFDLIYPEAFAWMCDCINILARFDKKPLMLCPYELLFGKRPLRAPLPFLMPGFHHARRTAKIQSKGEPCFSLDSSGHHSRDSYKILFPSGAVGFTTDVVFCYSRRPRFTGVVATYGGGAVRDP